MFGDLSPFEIFVSAVALLTGGYTAYKNFGERAKIRLYTSDIVWLVFPINSVTANRFHLMCNFVNKSTKVGTVHRLETTISGPKNESYQFVWSLFYKYLPGGESVGKEVDPHPIAIAQKDSKLVFIQFEVEPLDTKCSWPSGRYTFQVNGWVNRKHRKKRKNLKTTFHINITDQIANDLKSWGISGGSKEHSTSFPIPIEEWSLRP